MTATALARNSWRALFASFALVASLNACSDDTTAPATATALAIVSGDQQTLIAGAAAASPFVVSVVDQNGSPMGGVTVTWTLASGTGSLSTTTSATDGNGQAQVTYTAGEDVGAATISAAVSGLTTVTFNVTVTESETESGS